MKDKNYILILSALIVLILWQALLPGYVLLLDMAFTPGYKLVFSGNNLLNLLPLSLILNLSTSIMPAWIVQKIIFLALFFCLGFFSFKFLPLIENKTARFFSALIYMVNPFVYARFLAGQWALLFGYAFLPLLIHCLISYTKTPNFKNSLKLFVSLFLINLFSIHFFVMGAIATVMVIFISLGLRSVVFEDPLAGVADAERDAEPAGSDSRGSEKIILRNPKYKHIILSFLIFLVASTYWIIPAINRAQPIEQNFNAIHWEAFAATGYKTTGPILNLLSLNGFWAEQYPWAKYFAWHQDYPVFWIAFFAVLVLSALGLIVSLKNKQTRATAIFIFIMGIMALIFSTGAGPTIFKNFNLWLYEHVPFWSGFRDSQKFIGLLALVYAVFAGEGMESVMKFLDNKNKKFADTFFALIFLIPIFFGFLMWGGFQKQVRPVWYPENWNKAKEILNLEGTPPSRNRKVLVLPWHGYLSLKFNNNILSANPAENFFGQNAITSRSIEMGNLYDQETDTDYKIIDTIARGASELPNEEAIAVLKEKNIGYIVYLKDLQETDNLKYEFLDANNLKELFSSPEIKILKILD